MFDEEVRNGAGVGDGQILQEVSEAAELVEAEAAFAVEGR